MGELTKYQSAFSKTTGKTSLKYQKLEQKEGTGRKKAKKLNKN